MARRSPDLRDRVVGILTDALSRYATQEPELNGLLLVELLKLKATEAVPVIREAFLADRIDESMAGGWGDVRREFRARAPARRSAGTERRRRLAEEVPRL